jgi:uncharacterized protein YlxP (DUF503 family)
MLGVASEVIYEGYSIKHQRGIIRVIVNGVNQLIYVDLSQTSYFTEVTSTFNIGISP